MIKSIHMLLLAGFLAIASEKVETETALDDFEQSLLEEIEEVSDIATKTKLNIDEMPAFVTILYHQTLLDFGVDNAYEAFSLIPGVELSMESSGAFQVIFRGIKEKGKIKLLIDGIPINNAYRSSIYHYLDLPVDIIDRIEVIRGPGSVLYGSNAINAVINIVTKNKSELKESGLFLASGSYDKQRGGFVRDLSVKGVRLSMDAYYQKSDKSLDSGADKSGYSSKTEEGFEDYSLGLYAAGEHWSLTSRYKNKQMGTGYGISNYLPRQNDRPGIGNRTFFSEAAYTGTLGSTDYTIKAGYSSYAQKADTRFMPDAVTNNSDIIYGIDYKEETAYLDASVTSYTIQDHEIVSGVYFGQTHQLTNMLDTYYENDPSTQILSKTPLKPSLTREQKALYIQDTYAATQEMDISAGLRLDSYSDFGDALSPRIAAVYALSEKSNLKAMYSRAFRAPSWVELHSTIPGLSVGNSDLEAETADIYEVGFVHKEDIDNLVRLNFYTMQIDDIIYRDTATRIYTQKGNNRIYGGELEYRKWLEVFTTLQGSLSYVEGEDQQKQRLSDIANMTLQLRLNHHFQNRLHSGTAFRYISPRNRVTGDNRDELGEYNVWDQTFRYRYQNGIDLSFSIKNIFDETVAYPAAANTYPKDYVREGRTFMLTLNWEI